MRWGLFRIMTRFKDVFSRKKRTDFMTKPLFQKQIDDFAPVLRAMREIARELVQRRPNALALVPESQRQVFELFEKSRRSFRTIGKRLGRDTTNVAVQYGGAVRHLVALDDRFKRQDIIRRDPRVINRLPVPEKLIFLDRFMTNPPVARDEIAKRLQRYAQKSAPLAPETVESPQHTLH